MGRYITRGLGQPYNERDGGLGGKVGKDDFSIDGKSWTFRDPRNQNAIDKANTYREKGKVIVNPQSKERFDPLYDYDFGTVRDAAKQLGIGNVDEKKEVRQILKYIQQGKTSAKEQTESSAETQQQDPGPLLPRGERVPRFNEPEVEFDTPELNAEGGDYRKRYFLDKFVFNPPQLGSGKNIFDRYNDGD